MLPPKPLAFIGLVGILPSGLVVKPRQWFEPKIFQQSPDGARCLYRRIDARLPTTSRWRADSAGDRPWRLWRLILHRIALEAGFTQH
jgi:hypothetical protein